LAAVIVLAVTLIAAIIALIDSIPLSIRTIYAYTMESVGVTPRGDNSNTPRLLKVIEKESPVPIERVAICRASSSEVQSIVGKWPFVVLGLGQDDLKYFLTRQHTTSIEGRIPTPGEPEAIISEPVARNLGLHIGSTVLGPNLNSYSPFNVKVVGIAKTDRWLILDTIEYQRANHFPPVDLAMVFAKNLKDQDVLDHWAVKRFKGQRALIYTFYKVEKETKEMFQTLFLILNVVITMLVLVITMMMAMLINIYQNQRLVEFGLLQAIGFTKRQLITRCLLENVVIVLIGWGVGLAAAIGVLTWLRHVLMEPHSFALDVWDPLAYKYTIPVPITILAVAVGTVLWRFRKFDPVAVVERRLV
jgi:ABC-type lipoprotein release transport system permease subunit